MKVIFKDGLHQISFTNRNGNQSCSNIDYLKNVKGWQSLADFMICYCSGKQPTTIASWLSRINSTFKPVIIELGITSIPKTSSEWQLFIQNIYSSTLVTTNIKANIKTRVTLWNSNTLPFLVYIQNRDYIPIDVLIPKMKKVGQSLSYSSFDVSVIGDEPPKCTSYIESYDKLLCPVSLSRTDSEYLDELYYDLELKRDKLHSCLVKYWLTIKEHFDYANNLTESFNKELYQKRIESKDYYNLYRIKRSGPPRRRHFIAEKNEEAFSCLLYKLRCLKKPFMLRMCGSHNGLPNRSCITDNKDYYYSLLPKCKLEDETTFTLSIRLNWCLGLLTSRCISFLLALLIMENPKFNYESLLFSDLKDKFDKSWIEEKNGNAIFTIIKQRAKEYKTSDLSDISKDILSHLAYINFNYRDSIEERVKKKLFLSVTQADCLTIPSPKSLTLFVSGNFSDRSDVRAIYNIFPSLKQFGLTKSTISHKKIRDTEGVLEFFRTGSIKSVSRKLGNTRKTALDHYLPKSLVAAYNTRQVRRFQNLLIVAATNKEDYALKATDFNSVFELNSFIYDMLSMDCKGTNPLLNFINDDVKNKPSGELIVNISEVSLAILYAYRMVAEDTCLDIITLSKTCPTTGISSLSIINLSKHINQILSNNNDSDYESITRFRSF